MSAMLLLEALGKHDSCITWGRVARWLTSFEPYAAAQYIYSHLSTANAEKNVSKQKTHYTFTTLGYYLTPEIRRTRKSWNKNEQAALTFKLQIC